MDTGFVWDEKKYRTVQNKHNIRFHEVVSAFDDENGYEAPDPSGNEDRHIMVAKTKNERILFVVFSEEELPIYRLITAFDAEGKWLDEYHKTQQH